MAKDTLMSVAKKMYKPGGAKPGKFHRPEAAGNFDNMDDVNVVNSVSLQKGTIANAPVNPKDIVNKTYVDGQFPVTHASTTGRTTDDHHAQTHTILSHDTDTTGAELTTLADNSMADTLHRHSELSASDGTPDRAVVVDATGQVGIGTDSPGALLTLAQSADDDGLRIYGYDNRNTDYGEIFLNSLGYMTLQPGGDRSFQVNVPSSQGILFKNNGAEMMRIQSGKVGIGTDIPDGHLEVNGSAFPQIEAVRTSTNTNSLYWTSAFTHETSGDMADGFGSGFLFQATDSGVSKAVLGSIGAFRDGADTEGALRFSAGTAGSEIFMTIKSSGNVGIGTTSPGEKLDVRGLIFTTTGFLAQNDASYLRFSNTAGAEKARLILSGNDLLFKMAASEKMRIDSSGNVGIGTDSPGAKTHIDQSSTTAAIPVLTLDQADISEEMIEFVTTIGTGNAIEAVAAKTLTTTHFIKVTLPGGLTRYIPAGTIA